ncbi:MAG: outer membrane protein assembly factor BamE [Nitrospiraceae bacterium]|nr:MAG: outer membrane protein assembly factor BamE [Nitrospiraceae bacterium]
MPHPHLAKGVIVLFFKPMTGIIVVLAMTLLQGCVVTRGTVGEPFQEEAVSAIKKGTTTMAEVVSLIGAPDRIVRGNDREIFHYYYYDGKSPAMLLLLLNFIRMDVKSDNLYVFFNRDGIAEEVVYGKRTGRTRFKLWPFGD